MDEKLLRGKRGDKIIINTKEIVLNNSFELVNENDEEYYIIGTKKGLSFKIDKNMLSEILLYNINENEYIIMNWDYETRNKNFVISKFLDNNEINILNYIQKDYNNFGNKKCKYVFINQDVYDFRIKNIIKVPVIGKNTTKVKLLESAPKHFLNNDLNVLEEFEGHRKSVGISSKKERNNYKLIEITNTDGSKNKCYEVFLNNYDKDNNEYTFIIDEEDICILDKIYLFNDQYMANIKHLTEDEKQTVIVYKNPTWSLLYNQYVATSIIDITQTKYTLYIHRLLMGCQKGDNSTVDHINGNKFDNRKSNLRITSMSIQNQNRDNIKRTNTLNNILNPDNNPEIPTLTFDNLKFICFIEEENGYFDIEFKGSRTGSDILKLHSTKSNIFPDEKNKTLKIKLSHAICIRYLSTVKYPDIIKEKVDNQKFHSIEEFKTYSNQLITEVMQTEYTIDTFLDYMNTLKLPKYLDPRKDKIVTETTNVNDIVFNYINYNKARDKYDIDVVIGKDTNNKNIKYTKSGSGEKSLSNNDKKCFALLQRYNLFIELENDVNDKLHTEPFTGNINKNTSTLKTLTDYKLESKQFNNFIDFKNHTEKYINQLLNPNELYTLDTFADYINNKAATKKVNLKVSTLKHNYPIIVHT